LEYDVDLPLLAADGWQGALAETMYDGRHLLRLLVHATGKDDPGCVRIDLLPVQGRRIASELLSGQACRQEQR
jgi:hypothetical protein